MRNVAACQTVSLSVSLVVECPEMASRACQKFIVTCQCCVVVRGSILVVRSPAMAPSKDAEPRLGMRISWKGAGRCKP